MKKFKYKILMAISLATLMHARASEGSFLSFKDPYFGFNLAQSVNTKKKDAYKEKGYKSTLPSFDFMLGGNVTDNYRLEIAAGYKNFKYKYNDSTSDEYSCISIKDYHTLSFYTLMLNNYYDFATIKDKFTPYIMAGAGVSRAKSTNINIQYTEHYADGNTTTPVPYQIKASNSFAYQIGLGFDIKVAKNVNMDFGIRHIQYGKVTTDALSITKEKLKSNEVIIGIKYHF